MSTNLTIGIDLGTTNSCIGIFQNGNVEIIPNEQGRNLTPSFVAFTSTQGRLVGDEAKNQAVFEPQNTIFNVKRLIGRKFNDLDVQQDIKNWPFEVIEKGLKPVIKVDYKNKIRTYYPEEISSMILDKLKDVAQAHLKTDIKNCVITVPAYFNDSQRQATIDAGKIAGLNVLKIINEPTAAAIAYGFIKKEDREQNVLIYDLGGGTFDVSILKINGTNMKVLSTDGNTHLGGEDFDDSIIRFVVEDFEKTNKVKLINNIKAMRRIRSACEKAKITLSSATMTSIEVDNLINDFDMNIKLTRQKFEDINKDIFNSTIHTVENCLKEAKLTKDKIDEIVLVGGSSRIPKIRSIVQKFFNGKELNMSINPDEAVAYGATVCAAMVGGDSTKEIRDVSFSDVTSMSLGIEVAHGKMSVVIPRNTPVPFKKTQKYYTSSDNQTKLSIVILEGQSLESKNNYKLGEFTIEGFPPKEKRKTEFEITFEVDTNGILRVNCEETVTMIKNQISIKHDKGQLSEEDIQRMMKENKSAGNEHNNRQKISDEKNKIYEYCFNTEDNIPDEIPEEIKNKIISECQDLVDWLDQHGNETLKVYVNKYRKIKSFCEKHLNPSYINNSDSESIIDESDESDAEDKIEENTRIEDDYIEQTEDIINKISDQKSMIFDYCYDMKIRVNDDLPKHIKCEISEKCNEILEWMNEYDDEQLSEYVKKYEEIKLFCDARMIEETIQSNNDSTSSTNTVVFENDIPVEMESYIPVEMESCASGQNLQDQISDERSKIYDYCFDMKRHISDDLPGFIKTKIIKRCEETIKWLDNNELEELREYVSKYKEIQTFCNIHLI